MTIGVLFLKKINETTMQMKQVAVDESVRGQNVGRKMVNFAEQIAEQQLITALHIWQKRDYVSAITLAGAAEEILELPAEAADGDEANAFEVVLEGDLPGARAPNFDRGVAHHDAVGGRRRGVEIGQGDAAGVLIVVGASDTVVIGRAQDRVLPHVPAGVEAGKPTQVLLFHVGGALKVGAFGDF